MPPATEAPAGNGGLGGVADISRGETVGAAAPLHICETVTAPLAGAVAKSSTAVGGTPVELGDV
ncbi:hypothetical protein [Comamonas sp. JUb58]|uniref:hypothetical protein n=1 Tax=Comamonas sp. JUb58 TaxID=2485114 RepID=UPI0014151255|nr:hypothetical protein [Comamonas sp. JUb58]